LFIPWLVVLAEGPRNNIYSIDARASNEKKLIIHFQHACVCECKFVYNHSTSDDDDDETTYKTCALANDEANLFVNHKHFANSNSDESETFLHAATSKKPKQKEYQTHDTNLYVHTHQS